MRRNERIAVSLDPETKAAVTRLALAKGVSRSRLIADFMAELRPQLLQLAEIMERIKTDPAEALRRLDVFADAAVDGLAKVRGEHADELAEPRKVERQRNAGAASSPRSAPRKFWIEDLATGERWQPGLTWTDEAADRALATAQKANPGRNWVLREARI